MGASLWWCSERGGRLQGTRVDNMTPTAAVPLHLCNSLCFRAYHQN